MRSYSRECLFTPFLIWIWLLQVWKKKSTGSRQLIFFCLIELIGNGLPLSPCAIKTDSIDSPRENELDACIEEVIGQVTKQLGVEIDQGKSVDLNGSRIGNSLSSGKMSELPMSEQFLWFEKETE